MSKNVLGKDFKIDSTMLMTYKRNETKVKALKMIGEFQVETKAGLMTGRDGDYLVYNENEEPYIVPKETFIQNYEWIE